MSARSKRSERLKITLTPQDFQKLKLDAQVAKKPIATYAHSLLRQSLYIGIQRPQENMLETAAWVSLMGELYGLLDVVAQQMAEDTVSEQLGSKQDGLESLLNDVKAGIQDIQQTLDLLPYRDEV